MPKIVLAQTLNWDWKSVSNWSDIQITVESHLFDGKITKLLASCRELEFKLESNQVNNYAKNTSQLCPDLVRGGRKYQSNRVVIMTLTAICYEAL